MRKSPNTFARWRANAKPATCPKPPVTRSHASSNATYVVVRPTATSSVAGLQLHAKKRVDRRSNPIGGRGVVAIARGPVIDELQRSRCIEIVTQGVAQCGHQLRCGWCTRSLQTLPPAGQALNCSFEIGVDPFPVTAVVVCEQGKPDRHRIGADMAQSRNEYEVALRLGHLLALEAHHAGVDISAGKRLAGRNLCFGRRHLVVREHQIRTATLYIEIGAQ